MLLGNAFAAVRTVSANFQTAHDDVKPAIALDLSFQAIEQFAFQFHDFSAAQAGHVNVVTLRTALVKMLLALHVHQVELVDQAIALQQLERAVHGDLVNSGIDSPRLGQDLGRVQMLLCGFHHAENSSPLVGEPKSVRDQGCLQTPRGFSLWKRHLSYSLAFSFLRYALTSRFLPPSSSPRATRHFHWFCPHSPLAR